MVFGKEVCFMSASDMEGDIQDGRGTDGRCFFLNTNARRGNKLRWSLVRSPGLNQSTVVRMNSVWVILDTLDGWITYGDSCGLSSLAYLEGHPLRLYCS